MSDDEKHGHRVTLGDFRALTRDLPDDTLLVTGAFDESGIADATIGTVQLRALPREDVSWYRHTGDAYTPDPKGEIHAVFVDLNDLDQEQEAASPDGHIVHRDPGILGGTPVFRGTRVPARILDDHLEAGDGIHEFLEQFPTVSREQAIEYWWFAHWRTFC